MLTTSNLDVDDPVDDDDDDDSDDRYVFLLISFDRKLVCHL